MIKLKNIFKNRNTYMEELSVNLLKEISNRALSAGTGEGEKDSGYLPKKRNEESIGSE